MSGHDDSIAEIIPWVANNTASEEERRRVEAHIASCTECRELMDQARALAERGLEEGDLAGHPPAAILRELVEEPDRIPGEARSRLQSHVRDCPACRSAREALADLESPRPPGQRGRGGAIWTWLAGTLLSPQLALVYLLVLVAGLGWLASGPPATGPDLRILPPAVPLPGEILFRDTPSGEVAPILVDLPAVPGHSLHLTLEADIDEADLNDPAAAFEVRLSQDGRTVWSRAVTGTAFSEAAQLDLLVPTRILQESPVTTIEILLDRPGDPMHGTALYTRSIGVR